MNNRTSSVSAACIICGASGVISGEETVGVSAAFGKPPPTSLRRTTHYTCGYCGADFALGDEKLVSEDRAYVLHLSAKDWEPHFHFAATDPFWDVLKNCRVIPDDPVEMPANVRGMDLRDWAEAKLGERRSRQEGEHHT